MSKPPRCEKVLDTWKKDVSSVWQIIEARRKELMVNKSAKDLTDLRIWCGCDDEKSEENILHVIFDTAPYIDIWLGTVKYGYSRKYGDKFYSPYAENSCLGTNLSDDATKEWIDKYLHGKVCSEHTKKVKELAGLRVV